MTHYLGLQRAAPMIIQARIVGYLGHETYLQHV